VVHTALPVGLIDTVIVTQVARVCLCVQVRWTIYQK